MRLRSAWAIVLLAGCGSSSDAAGLTADAGPGASGGRASPGASGAGAGGTGGQVDVDAGAPDSLSPETFAGMHLDELSYDCEQTVTCRAQRGASFPPDSDPVRECIVATASLLNANPLLQEQFLSNFDRCREQIVCAYYECALQDAASYGEMHREMFEHDCQEQIQCMVDMGVGTSDDALAACVASSISAADAFSSDTRARFEETYATCSMTGLESCEWVQCIAF